MKPFTVKQLLVAFVSMLIISSIIAALGQAVVPPLYGMCIIVSCLLIEFAAVSIGRRVISFEQMRRIDAQPNARRRRALVRLLEKFDYQPDTDYSNGANSHIVYDPADEHAMMIIIRYDSAYGGKRYEVKFMDLEFLGPAEVGNRYRAITVIYGISDYWAAISYKKDWSVYVTTKEADPEIEATETWQLQYLPDDVMARIEHALYHWQTIVADY